MNRIFLITAVLLLFTQAVFAQRLRVNARTLQRWERGQSTPNDQAAALLLLVARFPDTLDRLDAATTFLAT